MTKLFKVIEKHLRESLLPAALILAVLLSAGPVNASPGTGSKIGSHNILINEENHFELKDLFSTGILKLFPLRIQLFSIISDYSGEWSVYVKDLNTGDTLIINDEPMYPASTIKAFAMAYTYDLISRGKLEKTDEVTKLLKRMITESDNTSFNQLVCLWADGDFLKGAKKLNAYLKKNGYTDTSLHHTLHPSSVPYTTDKERNSSSAKDCGLLLERINNGSCVNRASSREMKKLLLGQKRTWKIPASLPPEAIVANKTGETSEVQHDIAIVSGPKTSYVICVFSAATQYNGINGIKKISRAVWDWLEE